MVAHVFVSQSTKEKTREGRKKEESTNDRNREFLLVPTSPLSTTDTAGPRELQTETVERSHSRWCLVFQGREVETENRGSLVFKTSIL